MENDDQALNQLVAHACAMLEAGFNFARDDDLDAFAKLNALVAKGATPRLEITFAADRISVRAILIDVPGRRPLAQIFEMHAAPVKPTWPVH